MSSVHGPLKAYRDARAAGFVEDPAQAEAVRWLQSCFDAVHRHDSDASGVYLWGCVGRGKTWLMDLFHRQLECSARRQHFHHFMRDVHQRLFRLNGTADPLSALVSELALQVKVLCLDEFFVSDIGDAVILGGLVQRLFEQGVVMVMTSNQPPHKLYENGFNRERFLPAIKAIEARMQVVALDGEQDHRLHPGQVQQRYWVRQGRDSHLAELFRFQQRGRARSGPVLANHRTIQSLQHDDHQLWCTYAQLCEAPLAAADYIELCDRFSHVLLSDVPDLTTTASLRGIARGTEDGAELVSAGERDLPRLSAKDNGVRRFIALVDECYDRRVPLWIEAEVPMDALYPEGHLGFAFRRTLSRLKEMQFSRFGTD